MVFPTSMPFMYTVRVLGSLQPHAQWTVDTHTHTHTNTHTHTHTHKHTQTHTNTHTHTHIEQVAMRMPLAPACGLALRNQGFAFASQVGFRSVLG